MLSFRWFKVSRHLFRGFIILFAAFYTRYIRKQLHLECISEKGSLQNTSKEVLGANCLIPLFLTNNHH